MQKNMRKQKLTNKVEGEKTVLNNDKKNVFIDLILNVEGTVTVYVSWKRTDHKKYMYYQDFVF